MAAVTVETDRADVVELDTCVNGLIDVNPVPTGLTNLGASERTRVDNGARDDIGKVAGGDGDDDKNEGRTTGDIKHWNGISQRGDILDDNKLGGDGPSAATLLLPVVASRIRLSI